MLSALLGAICAASMAFAPMLVEPSSNISNNDGGFTSVHSAYYDANNLSDYGTTNYTFYNYSSIDIPIGWNNGQNSTILEPNNEYTRTGTGYNTMAVLNGISEEDFANLDIYLNGVLQSYTYGNPVIMTLSASGYMWFFDHYEYQLGAETVADIAEGLTDGIGTVATGIGGGLQSLVRNIFLVGTYDGEGNFSATGLSTFGIVTIVMASLALALGLSRWVVGWASSLGERNR